MSFLFTDRLARFPNVKRVLELPCVDVDEHSSLWATCPDGVRVHLGNAARRKELIRLEAYLTDHPTPDTW